jgi:thioredoxin reductase
MVKMWSDDVMLFTHGAAVPDERKRLLKQRGVIVVEDSITNLVSSNGMLEGVELESGVIIPRDAGFTSDDYSGPTTRFAEDLGVAKAPNDWGMEVLDVQETGACNVPGLYVIGDARSGFAGLMASAAQGAACMEGIIHTIAAERWAAASHG